MMLTRRDAASRQLYGEQLCTGQCGTRPSSTFEFAVRVIFCFHVVNPLPPLEVNESLVDVDTAQFHPHRISDVEPFEASHPAPLGPRPWGR